VFGLLLWLACAPAIEFIPWSEARRVIEAIAPEALPEELRSRPAHAREAAWAGWVRERDRAIRRRLASGIEDSLAHFLLFGTSFTREPRLTAAELGASKDPDNLRTKLAGRLRDLVAALGREPANERVLFLRGFLRTRGLGAGSEAEREQTAHYLVDNLARVLRENESYSRTLEAAQALQDPSAEFAERSRAFRNRGLSSDTSLLPNLAIEESLRDLGERGLLARGSVRRVAVVGPGLDFTDKQDGYDFYPQQSLQPFALADSLLRLGVASADQLAILTLDLSPQVNDHLEHAAAAGRRGEGYVLQLPRDSRVAWSAQADRYWRSFGDAAGEPVAPLPPPVEAGTVETRAARIKPAIVGQLQVLDANVVFQRPRFGPGEELDLIVATNVLVYYDVFEQCLALANAAAMLRVGGLLLSNNAVLELPGSEMRSVGYRTTAYSDREGDGDHLVWYRKLIVE